MRRWPTAMVLIVMLALGAGCKSTTGTTLGQNLDDTAITSKVKTKLSGEKMSNLTRVSVTTANGVVSLTGIVPTGADRIRAEEITRSVDGVQQVQNNLQAEKP